MDAGSSGFTVLRRFSGGNRGPAGEERRRGRRKVSVSGPSDAGNGCPADCLYGMRRVASKRVFRNESEYMNRFLNRPIRVPAEYGGEELRAMAGRDDKPGREPKGGRREPAADRSRMPQRSSRAALVWHADRRARTVRSCRAGFFRCAAAAGAHPPASPH